MSDTKELTDGDAVDEVIDREEEDVEEESRTDFFADKAQTIT